MLSGTMIAESIESIESIARNTGFTTIYQNLKKGESYESI